jgi:hypothetical protein
VEILIGFTSTCRKSVRFFCIAMSADHATQIRITRKGWCGIVAVLLLPWLVVLWLLRSTPPPAPAAKSSEAVGSTTVRPASVPAASSGTANATGVKLPAGPWGELEYTRIVIEPPEDYVPTEYIKPDALRWIFKGYSSEKLSALWQQAGLTPAQQQEIARTTKSAADGIVIEPAVEFVVGLTPQARAVIYGALAEFPENRPQNEPYRLRTDAAQDWFEGSGLSPEILTFTKSLLYERKGTVFFSDDDVVLPRIDSRAERVRFIKTLSRKSTLLVSLVVRPDTDAEAIARYWGRGRRSKDIEPLVQSLVRKPRGGSIDLVHLLPPFPRSLLYTYPLPSENPADAAHDCHWTALNFFNDKPDERLANIDFVKQTLLTSYYPVAGEPTMGDVIVLIRPDGVAVHSCIYLAADIVFTKNGAAYSVPWVFSTLDSVVAYYSLNTPLEIRRYRPKGT